MGDGLVPVWLVGGEIESRVAQARKHPPLSSQPHDTCIIQQEGQTIALKDFKGKHVAIYFYNKDDTPVVTKGGMAFAKVAPEFEKLGIPLLFIGPDRSVRVCEF
jgi:thioredoxin-dependent peroxiredoxin